MDKDEKEKAQSDIRVNRLFLEIQKAIEAKGNGCTDIEVLVALQTHLQNQIGKVWALELVQEEERNDLDNKVRGHRFGRNSRTCISSEHEVLAGGSSMNCWKANYNEFMRDTT